ncbi:MAG: MgtC/SapB family protein [Muribaculaceae bacterium]|nr:MgtC/SapB family protein [Muribaculaceae bacterium]
MIHDLLAQINSIEVTTVSSVFKLLLSLILGCCVGFERKRKGQTAGLRTFALISMGATLAMILSIYVPQEYMGLKNGDPGRIAAQVITGIGFLGAGAIIQSKGSVRGLTTAAGIWMVATIGLAVGVGLYIVAVVATALIIFILMFLEQIEHKVRLGGEMRIIRMKVPAIVTDIEPYRQCLKNHRVNLVDIYVEYDYSEPTTRLNLVTLSRETVDFITLFTDLQSIGQATTISLANQVTI